MQLLGPYKHTPVHAAARLQRWSLILASYHYDIEYRRTTDHANADSMSRVPLSSLFEPKLQNLECHFFGNEVVSVVTSNRVKAETEKDPLLSTVHRYVIQGWPDVVDVELVPFKHRKDSLTVDQGCILWGTRAVIPHKLRTNVLRQLHETHQGITRTKQLARSYVWWPDLDKDIENVVQRCEVCQMKRNEPPKATVHPWSYPEKPWSRVHIDFATPELGTNYLVIVDAYSKYPEVVKMRSTTTNATVYELKQVFSRHGYPEVLVSDNGPQFKSNEFQVFCTQYGSLLFTKQ